MITAQNKEKVKKFYDVVAAMQTARGREIGLLIIKKETLGDLTALLPNSNLSEVFDLNNDANPDEVIERLAATMTDGRTAIVRVYTYLDPKIYNQLYLLAKSNHMEYPRFAERKFFDAAPSAQIILVSMSFELDKLNYKNIVDLAGVIERL